MPNDGLALEHVANQALGVLEANGAVFWPQVLWIHSTLPSAIIADDLAGFRHYELVDEDMSEVVDDGDASQRVLIAIHSDHLAVESNDRRLLLVSRELSFIGVEYVFDAVLGVQARLLVSFVSFKLARSAGHCVHACHEELAEGADEPLAKSSIFFADVVYRKLALLDDMVNQFPRNIFPSLLSHFFGIDVLILLQKGSTFRIELRSRCLSLASLHLDSLSSLCGHLKCATRQFLFLF